MIAILLAVVIAVVITVMIVVASGVLIACVVTVVRCLETLLCSRGLFPKVGSSNAMTMHVPSAWSAYIPRCSAM